MRTWLKNLRKSHGLTQIEASEKMNMAQSSYSYIENGTRQKRLTIETLAQIHNLFGTPIEDLMKMELEETDDRTEDDSGDH